MLFHNFLASQVYVQKKFIFIFHYSTTFHGTLKRSVLRVDIIEMFFFCFVCENFWAKFAPKFSWVEFLPSQKSDLTRFKSRATFQTVFWVVEQRLCTTFAVKMFTSATLHRIFSNSWAGLAHEKDATSSSYCLFGRKVQFLISFSLELSVVIHHNSIFFRYFL